METVFSVLYVILSILGVWLTILMAFQLFVGFFGYKRCTKDYRDHEPEKRFLILVPAHNEEAVIADMVRNLQAMDYPKELYDFYILADNCTDRTADIARELGAKVLVSKKQSEDAPTGKPIALRKALIALDRYPEEYDFVMFFDADNLIDSNMLREVNSQYLDADGKADIIQCYLGCKNGKGLVAYYYYVSYTLTNRFFQFAKTNMKLNSVIGGTGFAVTTSYLKERGGWNSMSLTEDFELQVEAACEGKRILWNQYSRVYDEKPTSLRASFRQRVRWAQGHWFVAFRNTPVIFRSLLKRKIGFGEFFSSFLYMYSLTPSVILLFQLCYIFLVGLFTALGWLPQTFLLSISKFFSFSIPGVLLFFYCFIFLFYAADRLDNHKRFGIRSFLPLLVCLLINTAVASWAQIVGLAKHRKQNQWVKTEHRISKENSLVPSDGAQ